jgi:hypothetical protein
VSHHFGNNLENIRRGAVAEGQALERRGMIDLPPTDELLRPADVQARFNIAEGTLKGWRRDGYGPPWFRLGKKRVVYALSDLTKWIADEKARTRGGVA